MQAFNEFEIHPTNLTSLFYQLCSGSISESKNQDDASLNMLKSSFDRIKLDLNPHNWEMIQTWAAKRMLYKNAEYKFMVRDKEIKIATHSESLSHQMIPKVVTPSYKSWGDILRWILQQNFCSETSSRRFPSWR